MRSARCRVLVLGIPCRRFARTIIHCQPSGDILLRVNPLSQADESQRPQEAEYEEVVELMALLGMVEVDIVTYRMVEKRRHTICDGKRSHGKECPIRFPVQQAGLRFSRECRLPPTTKAAPVEWNARKSRQRLLLYIFYLRGSTIPYLRSSRSPPGPRRPRCCCPCWRVRPSIRRRLPRRHPNPGHYPR